MVDFRKKLEKNNIDKKVNPIEIYDTLDWASDKGELRPVQKTILKEWYERYKDKNETIVKLHTGQGKTLIGLLMLQSYLNNNKGPAIYLCPNNYLLDQTCEQARMFGIKFVYIKGIEDIPDTFIEGETMLITSCHKLFNGKSKFGINASSIPVNAILMDDAHQCIEVIKNTFKISVNNSNKVYNSILNLFSDDLKIQGAGTFYDILNKQYNAILSVPYWAWIDKYEDVTAILSKHSGEKDIEFIWPLIKDNVKDCECVISGRGLEIYPNISLIDKFGSYSNAKYKIFMSATLIDDSFLIKGLSIQPSTIKNALCDKSEKWSGEKMVLIPSNIDDTLVREEIVYLFGNEKKHNFGTVVLVPSFENRVDWEKYQAIIAKKDNIYNEIDKLKNKKFSKPLVIANRYDGIDLPDNACRILIFDSLPKYETIEDQYVQSCLNNSNLMNKKIAQTIEQGFGRAVRGPKDYCAIVIIGNDLVKFLRSSRTRKYLSEQTRKQIEIGIDIAKFSSEDIEETREEPRKIFINLVNQSLGRDDGWKEYYNEQMNLINTEQIDNNLHEIFKLEISSENKYKQRNYEQAAKEIQKILDEYITDDTQLRGWYLQLMARYTYLFDKIYSNQLQISAHKSNPYLLAPQSGMEKQKLKCINLKRTLNMQNWISSFENYEDLIVETKNILTNLSYNIDSDKFEEAIHDLGTALGFVCQRPDKEWKEGPDNLWQIRNNEYILIECKNKVDMDRKEISREEVGQMNISCAWFKANYAGSKVHPIMIISTKKLSFGALFTDNVKIITQTKLQKIKTKFNNYVLEFKKFELNETTEQKIHELIGACKVEINNLLEECTEVPK